MEIWDAINDTLSIIVWPMVGVIALWLFRQQIRNLISRLVEAELLGAKVRAREIERVSTEFGQRARDALGSKTEPTYAASGEPDGEAPPEEDDQSSPAVNAEVHGALPALEGHFEITTEPTFTRSQVEEFIKAAGMAGYEVGVIRMFQGPVEPVIEWKENVPEIDYWQSTSESASDTASRYNKEERVRRLEREIMNLTFKLNSPISGVSAMLFGEKQTLRDLKRQLQTLDPNSPWAQ